MDGFPLPPRPLPPSMVSPKLFIAFVVFLIFVCLINFSWKESPTPLPPPPFYEMRCLSRKTKTAELGRRNCSFSFETTHTMTAKREDVQTSTVTCSQPFSGAASGLGRKSVLMLYDLFVLVFLDYCGQDFCRILVLSDDGSDIANTQCASQFESQACVNASVTCHNPVDHETSDSFPPCLVTVDIEKGATDVSNIDQETCGSIKTEISLTKPLRRQNSLQTGGESIPPLMNHILMLLKFDAKEKQAMEKAHDATNNRWRKCKRAGLFDSRRIVLLFSILSSLGTLVLIFLTLRVRQVSDGYIHG